MEHEFVRACFTGKEMAYDALERFEAEAFEISYENNYIVLQVTPDDIKTLTNLYFEVTPYPDYAIHHNRTTGIHTVQWNGKSTVGSSPGEEIYLFRLQVNGDETVRGKMILVR